MKITPSLITMLLLLTRHSTAFTDDNAVEVDTRSGIGLICGDRPSFFGLEFVVSGYNILFAYPRGNGRDPGWRAEIFELRFDEEPLRHTSDCIYSIPRGFSIRQETRCSVDFQAREVRTSNELQSALSANARLSGGGWGVSFSGSVEYQSSLREMRNENSMFIISEAQCLYYYPAMDPTVPPPLSANFRVALIELQMFNRSDIYHDFFENYGTHFVRSLDYGARYTKRYKMSSEAYERASHRSISVEAQAQYEGVVSVAGGAGLTTEEKELVDQFKNDVEEHTFTVGALPDATGDPHNWAAMVKETPAPVGIELVSIEELFTPKYFRDIEDIDYDLIRERIEYHKLTYCQQLVDRGLVESCEALIDPKCEVHSSIEGGTVSCNYYSPLDVYDIENGDRCTVTCDPGRVNLQPSVRCEVFGDSAQLDFEPNCGVWMSNEPRSFSDALEDCYIHGGRLAEVNNDDELMSLYHHALSTNDDHRGVWIGGSDRMTEGRWIWEWSGRSMTYTAWGRNNPSNTGSLAPEGQDCLAIVYHYEGQLDDEYCFREYRYFCETPPAPECDITQDELCFWFVNRPKTFHDASLYCNSLSGSLAEVTNEDLQAQVYTNALGSAHGQTGIWVGGSDRVTEGLWIWEGSGNQVTSGWAPGKPDNAVGFSADGQDCMILSFAWAGALDDDYCFREYKFFCEKTVVNPATRGLDGERGRG